MSAERIVEALLDNGDDPKDYIDRTLPNGYIIRHANNPDEYFIRVDEHEFPSLVFDKKEASVFSDIDVAKRLCANINAQTGSDIDRYEVVPVENEVVEAMLGDDFDPSAEAQRSLGYVTRDQVLDWLADIGMTDYHTHATVLQSGNYYEVRGTMAGSHSSIEEKLFRMAQRWNLGGQMKWAIDAHAFAQPIPRAVQVLIPTKLLAVE